MSFEFPQDIPAEARVWVYQSSPRDSWPPLSDGKFYGFLPDEFRKVSPEPIPSLEERRVDDEECCELTPGFESYIRESRQLKTFYEPPTLGREVQLSPENATVARTGMKYAISRIARNYLSQAA